VLPTFPQDTDELPSAGTLAALCRQAEAAGATALWACDHLFWHRPAVECFTALAVAAAATTSCAVGSCVAQIPLRRPHEVAKQAASLQVLSGGRMVLGLGIGRHPGEYEAAGVAYRDRGRRLDAAIGELRQAWNPGPGRYVQLPAPAPVPVWFGGTRAPTLARTARHGEGWIPLFTPPDEYAAASERLDKEAERCGRPPATITRAAVVFVAVSARRGRAAAAQAVERGMRWTASLFGAPATAFARHVVGGDAARCAAELCRWRDAGAEHLALFVTADNPLVQFEELAGELAARTVGSTSPGDISSPSSLPAVTQAPATRSDPSRSDRAAASRRQRGAEDA